MSRTEKLCLENSTFCSDVADSSDLLQPESFSDSEVEPKLKLSSGSMLPHFTTGGVKGALASLAAEDAVDGESSSPKNDRRFWGRVDPISDDVRDDYSRDAEPDLGDVVLSLMFAKPSPGVGGDTSVSNASGSQLAKTSSSGVPYFSK